MTTQPQLSPAKKPCNICGGLISWDQTIRESIPTKLPLNLDRTVHDRASCNAVKLAHPGLPTENVAGIPQKQITLEESDHVKEAKITASLRSEAIAQAHEQNMESAEKTRESIDNLGDSLNNLANATREASEDSKQSIYYLSETINKLIDQKIGPEMRALTEELAKLRLVFFDILKVNFYAAKAKETTTTK